MRREKTTSSNRPAHTGQLRLPQRSRSAPSVPGRSRRLEPSERREKANSMRISTQACVPNKAIGFEYLNIIHKLVY